MRAKAVFAKPSPSYVATDLGTLGGNYSVPGGLNSSGQVVGISELASGEAHAFLWVNGAMTDLGTLGGPTSAAADINAKGDIVGTSETESGSFHAVLWHKGVIVDLGTLDGTLGGSSTGIAINESGQIVGYSGLESGETHAFLWQKGVMTDLGSLAAGSGGGTAEATDVNARGDIVGMSESDPDVQDQAVLWSRGDTVLLPNFGGHDNGANAINARGQVVGYADVAEAQPHAVVWERGVLKDLHPTGAEGLPSWALDINNAGQIVGILHVAPGEARAVLWQDGNVIFVGPGPNSYARAINASGQILGAIDQHAVLWAKR